MVSCMLCQILSEFSLTHSFGVSRRVLFKLIFVVTNDFKLHIRSYTHAHTAVCMYDELVAMSFRFFRLSPLVPCKK